MLKNTDFVLGSVKLRGCEEPTRDLRLVPHLSSFPEGLKKSAFGDCVGGYLGLRLTLAHLQAWLQVGGAIQGLGFRGYNFPPNDSGFPTRPRISGFASF